MQLDPPDHPMKAVACAIAIQAWTERWQREGLPTESGFGRPGLASRPARRSSVTSASGQVRPHRAGDTLNSTARFEADPVLKQTI
jgi:hypothetical protein